MQTDKPVLDILREQVGPLALHVEIERWLFKSPFRITGYTWEAAQVVVVTLSKDGRKGLGEAAGVYYRGETAASLVEQIEALRPSIERGVSLSSLQELIGPGGARNALDCALWDLLAKRHQASVSALAGLPTPQPLITTFTCGADTPQAMAAAARAYQGARAIKLKLTGEPSDMDRVRAVRDALPGVWLGVDANQGFTRAVLERSIPVLMHERVALVEQPLPIGQDASLDGLISPIPIAADESAQSSRDIPSLVGRYQVINIKLDKCGGLTEGLAMLRAARSAGLECMVGNMLGTSLAMAPACLIGQSCSVVDLDGPTFLRQDRSSDERYRDGRIQYPDALWG
jgi:L-Ala-D/L-Glu epimerase